MMSWLLPSNRRLRHLEGISLRNLCATRDTGRPRGRTIDDDSLPTALTSPTKLLAQREGAPIIEHSKSSVDLQHLDDTLASRQSENLSSAQLDIPKSRTVRPGRNGLRRRSTLNWAHESPQNRQKLLEEAVVERRLTTFFTLHRVGAAPNAEPLYVSEEKETSMNPDFKFFALDDLGSILRDSSIIIKVWARPSPDTPWMHLLEAEISLPSLVRIGKTLDAFFHPLPENCVVLHLADGVYTSFFDLKQQDSDLDGLRPPSLLPRAAKLPARETSPLNSLLKLKNLSDCIDDAVRTQQRVVQQIGKLIDESHSSLGVVQTAAQAPAKLRTVQEALGRTRRGVKNLQEERQIQQRALRSRREAISACRESRRQMEASLKDEYVSQEQERERQRQIKLDVTGQTRRVAQALLDIFRLEPVSGKPLSFAIGGLALPSAKAFEADGPFDEEAIAAALGSAALLTSVLERKVEIPLPYPIHCQGSTSDIFDPLSPASELGSTARLRNGEVATRENSRFRVFPLYQKGVLSKRFKCGVYLLNKNIEELMSQQNLRVMDPRNTLANLTYLLTVLSSGKGEIPPRKTGDVRGLSLRLKRPETGSRSRDLSPVVLGPRD